MTTSLSALSREEDAEITPTMNCEKGRCKVKSKNSITADEKKLLDELYRTAQNISDFLRRNGYTVPVSISVTNDTNFEGTVFDGIYTTFVEHYESGNIRRIVSKNYNHTTGKSDYCESVYEDKEDE